jgi:hypothetical protein
VKKKKCKVNSKERCAKETGYSVSYPHRMDRKEWEGVLVLHALLQLANLVEIQFVTIEYRSPVKVDCLIPPKEVFTLPTAYSATR